MTDTLNRRNFLTPEDYSEPECPLCMDLNSKDGITPVPQQRILEKLDHFMGRQDFEGAMRLLLFWMDEAKRGHDLRGQLMLCNELVGFFRKTSQKEKAFHYADQALSLLEEMDFGTSISAGTTCVNAATAYSAFGEPGRAIDLFRRAQVIYESSTHTPPHLLGGLYNNMALTCHELGQYDEAFRLYDKAMEMMGRVPNGVLEQAITLLNRADTVAANSGLEKGEQQIFSLLDQAYELLQDSSVPHNAYYAFVCEKCAPCFSYYGYFAAAEELQLEANRIYEGT